MDEQPAVERAPLSPPDCREAIETLYAFLDGELTSETRSKIQSHLDKCAPCLQAFDFESEIKLMIARHCRDEVPESLRQRVADALDEIEHDQETSQD